jgi:formate dehydrogenase maturation protein FdhE
VHIPSSESYSETDLAGLLQVAIRNVNETAPLRAAARTDSVPMCPVCGRMMVLRIHRSGPSAGMKYYGCMDSPKCSGVVEIG